MTSPTRSVSVQWLPVAHTNESRLKRRADWSFNEWHSTELPFAMFHSCFWRTLSTQAQPPANGNFLSTRCQSVERTNCPPTSSLHRHWPSSCSFISISHTRTYADLSVYSRGPGNNVYYFGHVNASMTSVMDWE